MNKVDCTFEQHGLAVQEILNHAIVTSTALYDYKPRGLELIREWFAIKQQKNFPIIGFEDEQQTLMGFASYGTFRFFPAYKYTVEHSIYVHENFRGRGLGSALMKEIIHAAQNQQYHVMIGALDQENKTSVALHLKHGFKLCGSIDEAAFKFGRWLNLELYQLTLSTPNNPVDD